MKCAFCNNYRDYDEYCITNILNVVKTMGTGGDNYGLKKTTLK